ncbi:MAG: MarR family winged helix-turn-helix transcriptional regulator [Bdellovibrionota bacterium]
MSREVAISENILELFMAVAPAALARFKTLTSETGLTIAHFRILFAVSFGMNRVGKLAIVNGISQPAMSKMVDLLVESKFLKRIPNPLDRRQVDLQLTTKARSTLKRHRDTTVKEMASAISRLSAQDQKNLESGIRALTSLFPDRRRSP